jgi:CheY-like chemotaxis protein
MPGEDSTLLWRLRGRGRDVRCLRRRTASGVELRVLWGDELFLTESFRDPDRLARRAEEFKATLQSRGWRLDDDDAGETPRDSAVESRVGEAAAATPLPRAAAGRAAVDSPRVLVVDDDGQVRTFMRHYLEHAGYAVLEASDVDAALDALDRQPVDAVVLDVRLPDPMGWGRTGLEVLAFIRLHSGFSPLPVLLLTGHPLEPEELDLVRRHGAELFLKPDGHRQLLARLDALTRGKAAGR